MTRLMILVVTLVAFGLTACGKSEAPAPTKTEAAKTEKSKTTDTKTETKTPKEAPKPESTVDTKSPAPTTNALIGTWVIDVEGFKQLEEFKSLPAEQQTAALAIMAQMKMQVEFTTDKIKMTGELMGQKKTEETAYSVVKQEGDAYTVEVTKKDGQKESQIIVASKDALTIKQGGKTLVLKRATAAAANAAPAAPAAPAGAAPAGGATKAGWTKGAAKGSAEGATKAGWSKGAAKGATGGATKAGWGKGEKKAGDQKATKAGWGKGEKKAGANKATKAGWQKGNK